MAKQRRRYKTRHHDGHLVCEDHDEAFPLGQSCPACKSDATDTGGTAPSGSLPTESRPAGGGASPNLDTNLANAENAAAALLERANLIGTEISQTEKWAHDTFRQYICAAAKLVQEDETKKRLEQVEAELKRINDRAALGGGDNPEPPMDSSGDAETAAALGLKN